MFTRKQKIQIVTVAFLIVLTMYAFLSLTIYLVNCMEGEKVAQAKYLPARVYQVVHHEEGGYYAAIEMIEADDGWFTPDGFYSVDDRMVVFLDENVQGGLPNTGDIVNISLTPSGEEPLVEVR